MASFILWRRRETPQCVRLPFAPCGPVQEVWWSPISFGSSDVRRRHTVELCRPSAAARVPAYRHSLVADQGRKITNHFHHDTNSVWRVAG